MTLLLTAYFWIFAVLMTAGYFTGLVAEPEVASRKTKSLEGMRVDIMGSLFALVALLPMTYLQVCGLAALGLPVWPAWLVYALLIVGSLMGYLKEKTVKQQQLGPHFLLLLGLAWVGLRAVT